MVREPAELVDRQVAVLGGLGDDGSVEAVLRGGLPSRRSPPGHRRRSVATGIAEHNGYAKTLIASASRKKP
jgi:hypothetical protein